MMDKVKDFDIDKSHIGILREDGTVFNYNLKTAPEKFKNWEEDLKRGKHHLFTPEVGPLKMIASGEFFNLLVSENNEVYIQDLLQINSEEREVKVEMISDYNSIHGTTVIESVLTLGGQD